MALAPWSSMSLTGIRMRSRDRARDKQTQLFKADMVSFVKVANVPYMISPENAPSD